MRIAYFANPASLHDCNWINSFADLHETTLVCLRGTDPTRPNLDSRVRVEPILPDRYPVRRTHTRQRTLREVQRVLQRRGIELVHSMYAVPNALWADELGLPHILTTRGSDLLRDYPGFAKPSGWRERLAFPALAQRLERALRRATFVTCTSRSQAQVALRLSGAGAEETSVPGSPEVHIIRTGVVLPPEIPARHGDPAVLRLFSPRSMKPLYNLDALIEGVDRFAGSLSGRAMTAAGARRHGERSVRLTLIDDQPDSEYSRHCREVASRCRVPVTFLPQQRPEAMIRHYLEADLALMIPRTDGTPVSALEAMALNTPVLLGAASYDDDLFGETCWRTLSNDAEAVAGGLAEFVSESHDNRERRTALAFETVTRLADREREMAKLEELYRRAALGSPAKSCPHVA